MKQLIIMLITAVVTMSAQTACNETKDNKNEDCICTQEYGPVCVKNDKGEVLEFDNECYAKCEGYSSSAIIDCNENSNNTHAEVLFVSVTGSEKAYTFSVEVKSPDAGCDQYANWWEVITEDGQLIYRRILAHSHTPPRFNQPFTRSGGPVNITSNQVVIIRAHMNTSGYGTKVFKGTVQNGFVAFETNSDFALAVANQNPQPGNCPF